MSRRLDDVRLAVLIVDGIELKGRTNVVALGITSDGIKIPLGLWEGSTENATVATALLSDLVDRGLDVEQGVLCVLDGAKALRKAVHDELGTRTPVQRCVRHKERNVLAHLPERDRPQVKQAAACLGARGLPKGARRAARPGRGARPLPPRRRRLAQGGPRGDAHPHPPRDQALRGRHHPAGRLPSGPPGVHQGEYGRFHQATTNSWEPLGLQGFLNLLCPPGPALHTAEHDS
jgi:Transposase, Mutator family